MATKKAHAFTAPILREWVMYIVHVPPAVSKAMGKGHVPVVVTVNGGTAFQATLNPRGGGAHKLYLNGEVRAEARAKDGDTVKIVVRPDSAPREVAIPPDLRDALEEADALATFQAQTASLSRHIIDWVDKAKREETRVKRIGVVVERTAARREKRADAAAKARPELDRRKKDASDTPRPAARTSARTARPK